MKISKLKTSTRIEQSYDYLSGIVKYGQYNDDPQKWAELLAASGTGMVCYRRFTRFVLGKGFADTRFYKLAVNEKGMTADRMLRRHVDDYCKWRGFAFHVNYQMGRKAEINYVPFENVRFAYDKVKGVVTGFYIHPDWGKRNTALKRFDANEAVFIDFYNPDPAVIHEQVEKSGGWDKYNGQLIYCSADGEMVYPAPLYDCVNNDLSTEDAVSSVKNRNAKNNFLPAGMLVVKEKQKDTEESKESNDFDEQFRQFQGDESACKIIKVAVEFDEEVPELVPFDVKNYDKEFDYSEKSVQANIGKVFMQPPVLRGELIAGKLGSSTEIQEATDFYNAITEPDRLFLEECYAMAFDGFQGLTSESDFTIIPLEYEVKNKETVQEEEDVNNITE